MNTPSVTVVVTSYNYGQYLKEAIDSVVLQSYVNLEIIVIDDGSTDGSLDVVRSIRDDRIVLIAQENKGVVSVRNRGIKESSGEFLMFLDADDKIPVDYVASNVSFLQRTGADIASTDLTLFGDSFGESHDVQPEFTLERMKQGNIVHIGSMIRRSCIGTNVFDETLSGRTHEDWDFFLGLALGGAKIAHNPDSTLLYRQHEGSRNNHEDSDEKKIEYARVYRDITHKYALLYPDQLAYLASTRFANLVTYIEDVVIPKVRDQESQKARKLVDRYNALLLTKEYRLGSKLLRVPRTVLSAIRNGKTRSSK